MTDTPAGRTFCLFFAVHRQRTTHLQGSATGERHSPKPDQTRHPDMGRVGTSGDSR